MYAPFFPPDQPEKFVNVHQVFGASNVAKLLNELPVSQREDAVNSLAYEAKSRLQDPVYGCVGLIYVLQHRLKQVQIHLYNAKKELATYIGPQAMLPMIQPGFMAPDLNPSHPSSMMPFSMQHPLMGMPNSVPMAANPQFMIRDPNQPQMIDAQAQAQQTVVVKEQQELFRGYEPHRQPQQTEQPQAPPVQQQQHELMSFNCGFELGGGNAYNQAAAAATTMSPSLALGSYESVLYNQDIHQQQQPPVAAHELQLQSQMVLHQQQEPPPLGLQQQPPQQRAKSEEGRSNIGPPC